MKKTIKLALVAILVTVGAATANAQLGVEAGYAGTKGYTKYDGDKTTGDNVNGFFVGVNYDMNIQGGFGLHYGLLYAMSLDKTENEILGVKYSTSSTGHYVNIPFRITYAFPISDSFKVFAYAGPRFDIGLAGKSKATIAGVEASTPWYKDELDDMARFDLKLGAGAGVQFGNIVLKAGYDWGMLNNFKDLPDKTSAKSNQFTVSLGYKF